MTTALGVKRMIRINGAIEKIEGRVILGWVKPSDDPAFPSDSGRLDVIVTIDDQIIESKYASFDRPDIGGLFGVRIVCNDLIDLQALVSGRMKVIARTGMVAVPIRILPKIMSQALASWLGTLMADFGTDDIQIVRDAISKLPAVVSEEQVATRTTPEKQHTLKLLAHLGVQSSPPLSVSDITSVPMPVGLVSFDGTTLLGKQGEAYLVGGGNRVLERFLQPKDDPLGQRLAGAWQAAISARAHAVGAEGIRFMQLVIPEKLSIYPTQFPALVDTPSALLRLLEEKLTTSDLSKIYVSGLQVLKALPPGDVFPRFDSHLTVLGSYTIFVTQLEVMGLPNPFVLDLSDTQVGVGDLALRFFGIPLYEQWPAPGSAFVSAVSAGLELIFSSPPSDDHIGTRYVWRNSQAPINLKVVAFANSFFERAGSARALSWWFCRSFREFHFIWSPNLDIDYVRSTRPDWVICQTIERFLPQQPSDTL